MYSVYIAVIIILGCLQKGVMSDPVITEKAICTTEDSLSQQTMTYVSSPDGSFLFS